MAIPNIMTSEYVDTELMMKGPINETTGQRMGPEWIGEIKSIGLFQSNQSKSNRRFFPMIDCYLVLPQHVILAECRKKHIPKKGGC